MLAYYVERAAQKGLIAFHTTNSTARVAAYGGADAIFGTNPMAFAFPTAGDPLLIDFATGAITWGDILMRMNLGKELPEGCAVGPDGEPTLDPATALAGAILPWGGPRGLGVSMIVQVLGILGGSDPVIKKIGGWGYFFLVFDPNLLMPIDDFRSRVSLLQTAVESSRPAASGVPVRVPGSRSRKLFKESQARGTVEIDDGIYRLVNALEFGGADQVGGSGPA
jgi:ureidoglycolate dehydrogenase (NAD+)